jgi:hypothetical protein
VEEAKKLLTASKESADAHKKAQLAQQKAEANSWGLFSSSTTNRTLNAANSVVAPVTSTAADVVGNVLLSASNVGAAAGSTSSGSGDILEHTTNFWDNVTAGVSETFGVGGGEPLVRQPSRGRNTRKSSHDTLI